MYLKPGLTGVNHQEDRYINRITGRSGSQDLPSQEKTVKRQSGNVLYPVANRGVQVYP